jgi:NTP pyrophosphatase (non-canonical NTP hydrolase)
MSDIKELQAEIRAFAKARDWEKYHEPGELARALMIEAGELNALFLWGVSWQCRRIVNENPVCESITDVYIKELSAELADAFIYAFRLADVLGLNVAEIVRAKMIKNAEKYPIDVAPRNKEGQR